MIKQLPVILVLLVSTNGVFGQQSTSYEISDHTFNSGGSLVLTSSNYHLTFSSVGDGVVHGGITSSAYQIEGSFGAGYPAPGEAVGLRFTDSATLVWNAERSAGEYNLYRDFLSSLVSLAYGTCEREGLSVPTAIDTDPVPTNGGYFYLVTAENRLGEEGTKGSDSFDSIRQGNVCP